MIRIKARVETFIRKVNPLSEIESYWLAVGYLDKKQTGIPRRFVMCRDVLGMTTYRFYTKPRRGETVFVIWGFRRYIKLTKEQVKKHYDERAPSIS